MEEFKDSKTALVADVDCTADGKDLCEKNGVQGYPTIMYGEINDLKKYEGGRDFESLKKFADENLGPTCGPENLDLCDEDTKALIAKLQEMQTDELQANIDSHDAKLTKIEANSQKKIDALQKKVA